MSRNGQSGEHEWNSVPIENRDKKQYIICMVKNDAITYMKNSIKKVQGDYLRIAPYALFDERNNHIMKQITYVPIPVDTTGVILPKELLPLIEKMAMNVHEVWAESRIKDGWRYGPSRNDKEKTSPCLVPYEELPEREKTYDRDSALGTIKLIMKLGFSIIPNR